MTRKEYGLMLCLVTLSGLIGGSRTSWLVSGEAVAEGSVPTAKVLQTERLQIVDANGQVRIELSAQPRGTASRGKVFFYDKDGNKRSLPGKGIVRDAEET